MLNKKGQKKSQIINLQDSTITATRTQLEERGQIDLMTFSTNIKAIVQVWTNVQNDALLIKKWLEDGASDAVSHRSTSNICRLMFVNTITNDPVLGRARVYATLA